MGAITFVGRGTCALVLAVATLACNAEPLGIGYEVAKPFRLFSNAPDFSYYLARMEKHVGEATAGSIFQFPDPLPTPIATAWSENEMRYEPGYANQGAGYEPKFSVRMRVAPVDDLRTTCYWQINDEAPSVGKCDGYVLNRDVKNGEKVTVEVVTADGARSTVGPIEMALRDRLIVALGDSYLSGEGVPDLNVHRDSLFGEAVVTFPPRWWDTKCHRSLSAAAIYSSALLSTKRPHESFTVLSYACSGAEIGGPGVKPDDGGLLSPYTGRETAKDLASMRRYWPGVTRLPNPKSAVIPAQLSQLVQDLCPTAVDKASPIYRCPSPMRPVDVLIVGVGGNDVSFGPMIVKSILKNLSSADYKGVDKEVAALPSAYERLATRLAESGVAFSGKVMMDYGNPTQKQDGEYCSDEGNIFRSVGVPGVAQITKEESRLAKTRILDPLNKIADDFVLTRSSGDWVRFRKTGALTDGRGVCTRGRFTSMSQANAKQGVIWSKGFSSGVFHPNFLYHYHQAHALAETLAELLDRQQLQADGHASNDR